MTDLSSGPRGAGRPKGRTANDTKTLLLDAAAKLWSERGFDEVSVADICEVAGVTQAAFFYHHKSMSALVVAVFRREMSLAPLGEWLIFTESDTINLIDELVDLGANAVRKYPTELARATVRAATFDEGMWSDYQGLGHIAELTLRRGQARGEVRNDIDLQAFSRAIVGIAIGVMIEWTVEMLDDVEAVDALKRRLKAAITGCLIRSQ